jgi:hypothetical protein
LPLNILTILFFSATLVLPAFSNPTATIVNYKEFQQEISNIMWGRTCIAADLLRLLANWLLILLHTTQLITETHLASI